jgi:hypothetical protein
MKYVKLIWAVPWPPLNVTVPGRLVVSSWQL